MNWIAAWAAVTTVACGGLLYQLGKRDAMFRRALKDIQSLASRLVVLEVVTGKRLSGPERNLSQPVIEVLRELRAEGAKWLRRKEGGE